MWNKYSQKYKLKKVFVERLQEGNQQDLTLVDYPVIQHNACYDKFTNDEVRLSLKQLKRNTAAGIDGIKTLDMKKVPIGHITAIMNFW